MNPIAWIDVLTPKQALISVYLYEEFRKREIDVIVTCRKYDYTIGVLKNGRVEPVIIGEYGGRSLLSKLIASSERQLELSRYWLNTRRPDIHISMTSPEGTRVAFGLRIPILLLSDTPHSIFVNKLTIPLADTESVLKNLGLTKYEYVVLRPGEFKAAYYPTMNIKQSVMSNIISELLEHVNVVILPRYVDQYEFLKQELGDNIIIPDKAVDTLSLEYYALLVVTGGLTMATEAALMGTPAITFFPKRLDIEKFLEDMGFPIYHLSIDKLRSTVLKIIENPQNYRKNTRELLSKLEDPTTIILERSMDLIRRRILGDNK